MKILQSKKVHTVVAILLCAGIMPITLLLYRISIAYCRSAPLLMHFLLPLCHCVLGALFVQAVKELRCRHLYNILYHSLGAFAFFAYFEWMAPPGLWWLRYCSFIYQIPVILSAIVFLFFFVHIAIGKRKLVIFLSERKLFIAYIAGIVGILFVLPLFAMLPDRSESVYRICSVCGYLVLPLEVLCAFEVRKHQKTRIVGYALLGGTVLIGIFLVIFIGWQLMDHFVYFKTTLEFGAYPLLLSVFFTPFSIFIVERLYSTKRGGEEQQRERVQA